MYQYNLEDGRLALSHTDLSYAYAATSPCISLKKLTPKDSKNINIIADPMLAFLFSAIMKDNEQTANQILNYCKMQDGEILISCDDYKPLDVVLKQTNNQEKKYIITQLTAQIAMTQLLRAKVQYIE